MPDKTPVIIDGKSIATQIKSEIAVQIHALIQEGKPVPHLAAVLVGEDPASQTYIHNKEKACHEVGFVSSVYRYPETISEKELFSIVDFLNNDPEIDGFIVQLPLPKHIDESKIIERIFPEKDIDGFHPMNVGRMVLGFPSYHPATPHGIMTLLERSKIEISGKNCVVLGRSNIVGTPMSILLSRNNEHANATVTLCHSRTQNLKQITVAADILIVAIGKPEYVTADMVKEGAVVIDVGIHRVNDDKAPKGFRMTGDVKYDEVMPKCSAITPVPGGVGPMTIASLLMNTFDAYKKRKI